MKKIIVSLAALLVFGIASAQTRDTTGVRSRAQKPATTTSPANTNRASGITPAPTTPRRTDTIQSVQEKNRRINNPNTNPPVQTPPPPTIPPTTTNPSGSNTNGNPNPTNTTNPANPVNNTRP